MRLKLKEKLGKGIAIFAIAFSLTAAGMETVSAIGVSRDFEFNFIGNGYWDITEEADKNDPTYISMKCTYAEISNSCFEAVVVSIPGAAQCCPTPYRFYQGTHHYMTNYVYENGYRKTRIDAYCVDDVYGQGAMFSGWWYAESDLS